MKTLTSDQWDEFWEAFRNTCDGRLQEYARTLSMNDLRLIYAVTGMNGYKRRDLRLSRCER